MRKRINRMGFAIALMFGLFKYKPSPFCLLDEIDAPLDDANIGRFVEMLRGMQRHTSFWRTWRFRVGWAWQSLLRSLDKKAG